VGITRCVRTTSARARARLVGAVAVAVASGAAWGQPAPGMYATDNAGNFFLIDLSTAAPTVISSGRACSAAGLQVTELEFNNATGAGIVQNSADAFSYNELDFTTGLPSGPTTLDGGAFQGMEWIGGTLYGTVVLGGGGASPSELWTLDPATGMTTVIGPTGVNNISGLALQPGTLSFYGVTAGANAGGTSRLVTIDSDTGLATVVGDTGLVLGSLEFGPDGRLFAGGGQGNANELWEINPSNAEAWLIGDTGLGANAITGLAYVESPEERRVFYAIKNTDGVGAADELLLFDFDDPSAFALVGPVIDSATGLQTSGMGGLDFNGDGTVLYACDSFGSQPGRIYTIDPASGLATAIGDTFSQMNDLAWDPARGDLFGADEAGHLWANLDDPAAAVDLGPFSVPGMLNVGLAFDSYGNLYVHDIASDTIYVARPPSLTTLTLLHILPYNSNFTQGLFVDWSRDDAGYHTAREFGAVRDETWRFGTLPTGGGYGPKAGDWPDGAQVCDLTRRPVPPCGFVNRSFETGDFTGWETRDLTDPFWPLAVRAAGAPGDFFRSAPTDGVFSATHGYDGNGASSGPTIRIAQDVLVREAQLRFDWRAAWDMDGFGATQKRAFDVVIGAAGNGPVVARYRILNSGPGTEEPDTGTMHETVDLSPFKGVLMSVGFEWTIPEDFTGPGQFDLDHLCITRPCPGDVNGDDRVDIFDFAELADAFGQRLGERRFNPGADLTHDGVIDVFDFAELADDFGCGAGP
jgi:hypothetical protein